MVYSEPHIFCDDGSLKRQYISKKEKKVYYGYILWYIAQNIPRPVNIPYYTPKYTHNIPTL